MPCLVGVRREDKNEWERRSPLTPKLVRNLLTEEKIRIRLQPSANRIFSDEEYVQSGAEIDEDLSPCAVVFAVKEMPVDFIHDRQVYIFFSHTIKGQPHNMPMLQRLLSCGCTLIDYERIADEHGRRLVFFGRYAGLAGMIDTLWVLGSRLAWEGLSNPFEGIEQAWRYKSLAEAESAVSLAGRRLSEEGLPEGIKPLVIGFAGYGNVSTGAQQIVDLLPEETLAPEELAVLMELGDCSTKRVYNVVFEERHIVRPKDPTHDFELQDYYDHPQKYEPVFEHYLPYLTVLVNCIYWDERYPRLVTKEYLRQAYAKGKPKLRVIGDLSCDIEGAVEATVLSTNPGNPVYVYNPATGETEDGVAGDGVVILAVDNLPCELSREASEHFSAMLKPFISAIVNADYSVPFKELALPDELKRAVIVYKGKLTPNYEYMRKFL